MKASETYFSENYAQARRRFLDMAAGAGGRLEVLPLDAKDPNGEALGIDIASFGAAAPRRVLVHSSGLHGVEGFAGSAIQLQFLDALPKLPEGCGIVLAHVLNPYGMAWLRRVNEHNVDLNRNFRIDGSHSGAPPAYAKLDAFLNPRTPPAFDFFLLRAALLIQRYGMSALKQSVVGGQYEYPNGLFFGGKQSEQGPRVYEAFLRQRLATAEKAIVIDVHTGLGKFGEDLLLVDRQDYARLSKVFGNRVTALEPEDTVAYRIDGGLESMVFRAVTNTRPIFVGQEFGTYKPTTVVHALREENRWHHYGKGTLNHRTKGALKETFAPADESWRTVVLKRGRELLDQAIAELTNDR